MDTLDYYLTTRLEPKKNRNKISQPVDLVFGKNLRFYKPIFTSCNRQRESKP